MSDLSVGQLGIPSVVPAVAPIQVPLLSGSQNPGLVPSLITQEELNVRLEAVRKEEHAKIYAQQQQWQQRAEAAEKLNQERLDSETAAKEAAQKAIDAKRIEEMSAKEVAEEYRRQSDAKFAEEHARLEQFQALWQKEQEFARLQSYRRQVYESVRDTVLPELADYLIGPDGDRLVSAEEIDARAVSLVRQSADIMGNMKSAQEAQLRSAPTIGPTTGTIPGFDPMAALASGALSPDQIDWSKVDMATYAAMRSKLPPGRAGQSQSRGIFG